MLPPRSIPQGSRKLQKSGLPQPKGIFLYLIVPVRFFFCSFSGLLFISEKPLVVSTKSHNKVSHKQPQYRMSNLVIFPKSDIFPKFHLMHIILMLKESSPHSCLCKAEESLLVYLFLTQKLFHTSEHLFTSLHLLQCSTSF